MGTRSLTTIFDEQNRPLLSLYRQFDGYYDGMGKDLQEFLKDMAIVNGLGDDVPEKAANGMGCLAAQLIAHFKKGIGEFYILPCESVQEYNYEIRYVKSSNSILNYSAIPSRVSLVGKSIYDTDKLKEFQLYGPKILKRVQFVYDKRDNQMAKWRTVDVTEEDDRYIKGIEVATGEFKNFLKSRILGGRILPA